MYRFLLILLYVFVLAASSAWAQDGVGADDYWPTWSPDGTQVAISACVNGDLDVFVADASTGAVQNITDAHDAAMSDNQAVLCGAAG